MKKRLLGRTKLECSEIGLGTWALGAGVYGKVELKEACRLIEASLDQGINFFDTAPLYGTSEESGVAESVLGKGLGSRRGEAIISTKFGRTSRRKNPPRFTAEEARSSCEASLRRLGRDWIDVLFFHSPFSPDEIDDGVWEELGRLRDEGKVRSIGHSVSKYPDTCDMSAEWMRQRRIDAIQVVLSPFNREARPLIRTAMEEGCGVVARECLANGFLSGAITKDTVFPAGTINARHSREEIAERVAYADRLKELLVGGEVKTLPQASYRWILDQPGVSLALSGAKRVEEMMDSVAASRAPSYGADALRQVEEMHKRDFEAA